MLSKHPLEITPGRKLSKEEVVEALRLSIIAELDAINLYLQLARAVDDEKIRRVFEDIAREEKTHVGEFLALLKHFDIEQVNELSRGAKEVEEIIGSRVSEPNGPDSDVSVKNRFEESIVDEVKKLVNSARVLVKKLPVVVLGRGIDSVPLERVGEKIDRILLPLCEVSYKFKISQRAVDYAIKTGQSIDMPEAVKIALSFATEEDRIVVETLVREGGTRVQLSTWDEPGVSVIDIAKAVSELAKYGLRRPYLLIVSPTRYTKLLAVSEKTGVTDLERVKMLVDDIVVLGILPSDKALIISATSDVLDVVYGGNAEVDYIGPEDGYHTFRLWSTIATRVKIPLGIVVMETGAK